MKIKQKEAGFGPFFNKKKFLKIDKIQVRVKIRFD